MAFSLKNDVRFASCEMAIMMAALVVRDVCAEYGVDCVVTCGVEEHTYPSKHVLNAALDFRTNDLSKLNVEGFTTKVKDRLTDKYGVLFEGDHLHVQYPKKGASL